MELRRYAAILRRHVLLIALTVAVAVGFTIVTADRSTTYTARTTLYIGANTFSDGTTFDPNLSGDQQNGLSRLIQTFSIMIRSEPIASDALERTGLPRSAGSVVGQTSAAPVTGTNILIIQVTDRDPAVAQQLSIGMAEAFVAKITQLEPGKKLGEGDLPSAPATIFERAKLPVVPEKASALSGVVIAGLLGLLLSAGTILLLEYLDVTVKSVEDAEQRLELPVLGVIPQLALDPSTTLRRPPTAKREQKIGLVRDA
jgi:capsular polysaccharide biosynthesis protein